MGVWIFGYASLIWKPGFAYEERVVGFIKGYRRALHLACTEHRGTPYLPARVATLEADPDALCWGVAYSLPSQEAADTAFTALRARESEYDTLLTLDFYTPSSPNLIVIPHAHMFTSSSHNNYYLGSASFESMASQIAMANGPCGTNCEYLFRLVDALRAIGHEDADLLALARAVTRIRIIRNLEGIPASVWPSSSPLISQVNDDASARLLLLEAESTAQVC